MPYGFIQSVNHNFCSHYSCERCRKNNNIKKKPRSLNLVEAIVPTTWQLKCNFQMTTIIFKCIKQHTKKRERVYRVWPLDRVKEEKKKKYVLQTMYDTVCMFVNLHT